MRSDTNSLDVDVGRYTDTTSRQRAYWPLDMHGSVIGATGSGGTVALSKIASQAAAVGVTVWAGGSVPGSTVLPTGVAERSAIGVDAVRYMLADAPTLAPLRRRLLIVLDDADELMNDSAISGHIGRIASVGRKDKVTLVTRVHDTSPRNFGGSAHLRFALTGTFLLLRLRHRQHGSLIGELPDDLANLPPGRGYLSYYGGNLRAVHVDQAGNHSK